MARPFASLRAACAHRFSSYARACGADLARRSKAVVVRRGPSVVALRVGAESVTLALARGEARIHASCTCPLFLLGLDGCRHLWAALVVLDREGKRRKKKKGSDGGPFRPIVARADFDLVPRRAAQRPAG